MGRGHHPRGGGFVSPAHAPATTRRPAAHGRWRWPSSAVGAGRRPPAHRPSAPRIVLHRRGAGAGRSRLRCGAAGGRPMGGRGSGGPDRRAAREAAHLPSRLTLARGGRRAEAATQSRANARIGGDVPHGGRRINATLNGLLVGANAVPRRGSRRARRLPLVDAHWLAVHRPFRETCARGHKMCVWQRDPVGGKQNSGVRPRPTRHSVWAERYG